jgi:hypothetical protein
MSIGERATNVNLGHAGAADQSRRSWSVEADAPSTMAAMGPLPT